MAEDEAAGDADDDGVTLMADGDDDDDDWDDDWDELDDEDEEGEDVAVHRRNEKTFPALTALWQDARVGPTGTQIVDFVSDQSRPGALLV